MVRPPPRVSSAVRVPRRNRSSVGLYFTAFSTRLATDRSSRPGSTATIGRVSGMQVLVHPVRHPQQRQLAQGGLVAGAEIVGEDRIDLVRLVDVAVGHPAAQRLRGC
jgi:hypothetical protein